MKAHFHNRGQSFIRMIIVFIFVVVGFISAGLYYYLQKQISELPEVTKKPAEEVVKQEKWVTPPPEEALPQEEIPPEEENVEKKLIEIPCQNECSQPGLKKCSDNGYQICGNYDADVCLEWSFIAHCPSDTICQNGTCKHVLVYEIPVLLLRYFPLKNGKLDPAITGMQDDLSAMRAKVDKVTNEIIDALEKGSAYHQYKDRGAVPSLDYYIIEKKEFLSPIPHSNNQVPWNRNTYRPDYYKILSDVNICNYVENQGVKEVWIWGYHYGDIEPVESNMAGPYGDISNSERIADMPVCSKTYTLYNYNYGRGTSEAVENHMHQIEAVLNYIDTELFWNRFVKPFGSQNEVTHCGWAHYPPNGKSSYDWANQTSVLSDCEDWKPDGSGIKQTINCERWNCDSLTFFIWWMQNIPGLHNNLTYQGKKLKNWWDFIGDFDAAIQAGKTLTY